MHPNMLCVVNGLQINNMSDRQIGIDKMVACEKMTTKHSAAGFVDTTFKFVDNDGVLIEVGVD